MWLKLVVKWFTILTPDFYKTGFYSFPVSQLVEGNAYQHAYNYDGCDHFSFDLKFGLKVRK
ncbi:hypothetical protein D1614_21245 [Maribellus luteus]|uniref:Uncharacterized protein n=1 Tax=Maribellus luteus TaxID=2305463 RepID=A0A399SP86_9BACT|nr:hypothetical protein D1614_21245 [Maribellus luteus]